MSLENSCDHTMLLTTKILRKEKYSFSRIKITIQSIFLAKIEYYKKQRDLFSRSSECATLEGLTEYGTADFSVFYITVHDRR